jgi:hypothetical protein
MSDAIDLSTKETYQLVSFVHAGGAAYYTDWTSDVTFGANLYISTPDIEVKLPTNDGLFGENVCSVAIPLVTGNSANDTFAGRISNGQPHAQTEVTVSEILRPTTPGPSQTVNTLFVGAVTIVSSNYRQRRDKVQVKCMPIKSRVATVAMGIPCHHLCGNNLGDASCKVVLTGAKSTPAIIASIDGREVTINTNATIQAQGDRFYHRGYLKFQNLFIGIQDWRSATPLVFNLVRQPPAHWVGQTILVVAGCDKSIETCRARFSNEANFLGLGFAMPSYHPNFEDAP